MAKTSKASKANRTRQPNLRAPPECIEQLKPHLYDLAVAKGRGCNIKEVTAFTTARIMPIWKQYELGDVAKFAELYPPDWDSRTANEVCRLPRRTPDV